MWAASPMRSSGAGRPSSACIGRLSQGPGSAARGQVPSLSEPRMTMSGCCRRELVGLPDGNARMGRRAQSDRLLVDDAAVELRVVGRRHVGRGHIGIEQRGKELGGRLAGFALPHAVGRLRAAGVGQGLGGFGMRVGDRGKRGLGRRLEQCFERPQRQLQRLHELGRGLPVVALRAGSRRRCRRLPSRRSACARSSAAATPSSPWPK